MRRGFTLIEILIASSVLGLGVLGIATLFAGAAQQQKLATEQTDSLRVAGNIDALLGERYTRFTGGALSDDGSVTAPYLAPGQWHAVPALPAGGAARALNSALLLDLVDDGVQNQTLFGLAEVGEFVLYRAAWTDPEDVPSNAWNTPTPGVGQLSGDPYDVGRLQTLSTSSDALLQVIPHGRLQPGFDVVVTFEAEVPAIGGVGGPGGAADSSFEGVFETLTFSYRNWNEIGVSQTVEDLWPLPHTPPGNPLTYVPTGFRTSDRNLYLVAPDEGPMGSVDQPNSSTVGDSYLQFQLQRAGTTDAPRAVMSSCRINLPNNTDAGGRWIVREIRLENLEYRDDRLLSLGDRLHYVADEGFPGGRRPSRGIAMLYRRSLRGQDQLLTLSYTLEPLGRVRFDPAVELPLVLPDTFDRLHGDDGLLEQVQMTLGYDPAVGRYTLTPTDPLKNWAVEKGQYVVVGAKDNRVDALAAARGVTPDPGADSAVRVVNTRATGMNLTGFLDDSPRESLRSMLPGQSGTVTVWAWALRDLIMSEPAGDDSVEWRVRPTGARILTLGGGG